MTDSTRFVYSFGAGTADGDGKQKELLGGKGAGLAEMSRLGLPVPPGFTLSTGVCTHFVAHDGDYPAGLEAQVEAAIARAEQIMGKRFGDTNDPLLLSVRSGAAISMPGMMDTVLNLGLNDVTVEALATKSDNPRFAYDSYRRFGQMYGNVVMDIPGDRFEHELDAVKREVGATRDTDLTADDLKDVIARYKRIVEAETGKALPQDPREQLWGAIGAVFESWNNPRANTYRKLNRISDDMGTAVNVQCMVYGNLGATSGTGVAFTRNPADGRNEYFGEYLMNAQGEDVVAGTRTPQPLTEAQRAGGHGRSLEVENPAVMRQLVEIRAVLETRYTDMQDIEFTIQEGKLWMLQTRSGKRTGLAALRIAADLVDEEIIDKKTALMRIEPEQLNQLLRPIFDPNAKQRALGEGRLLAIGLPAGPGAACGRVAFTPDQAEEYKSRGEPVILTRLETSPEDIRGMAASEGILTARGGMTSHAALVGRQMGKVVVAGCEDIVVDYEKEQFRVGDKVVKQGDFISLEGSEGQVIQGEIPTRPSDVISVLIDKSLAPEESDIFRLYDKIMGWADEYRRLEVWTNADQPDQAAAAIAFGAQGIGLTRTEHMFFEEDRIDFFRQMILARDVEGRKAALAKLEPFQRADFRGLFETMLHRPVTIRLLDPPLHEFLPHSDDELRALAGRIDVPYDILKETTVSLHESNPMLGHRGCRLSVTYPEIAEMQVAAIINAACEAKRHTGVEVKPEIMIPLVSLSRELSMLREVAERVAKETIEQQGIAVHYTIGTMIELPRACICADTIGKHADFFSFGTNDLTQTTYGFSRDDAGKFLAEYLDQKIFTVDPFVAIDQHGVGGLMEIGVQRGRQANPKLKVGICGEHGGEPTSVEFCHRLGLNYVSCSPYRVPIARVAAAQAVLRGE